VGAHACVPGAADRGRAGASLAGQARRDGHARGPSAHSHRAGRARRPLARVPEREPLRPQNRLPVARAAARLPGPLGTWPAPPRYPLCSRSRYFGAAPVTVAKPGCGQTTAPPLCQAIATASTLSRRPALALRFRPLRKPRSARACCPRSWRSSRAGASRPTPPRLAPSAAGLALGRLCDRPRRRSGIEKAIVRSAAAGLARLGDPEPPAGAAPTRVDRWPIQPREGADQSDIAADDDCRSTRSGILAASVR
jgi:hypothetical protein